MNKSIKILCIGAILTVMGLIIYGVFNAIIGNFFTANFHLGILLVLAAVLGIVLLLKSAKAIWYISGLFLILSVASCNYAKSNQRVVVSDDCGMNWKEIQAGSAVPRAGVNPCYMKVVMPNFPMQGESKFIGNLKDHVRAGILIDYDYSITSPLAFIKQAKYLGKANTNADSDDALDPSAFEGAENAVIDKRIKEVAKDLFLSEDIVELEQADLENKLLEESNKILEPFGVHLNFITLTFDLDEQTRQAIDVSTAMKIYESKNLTDVGKEVIIHRAGATKITVENKTEQIKTE